jgi:hypothetical protein
VIISAADVQMEHEPYAQVSSVMDATQPEKAHIILRPQQLWMLIPSLGKGIVLR